MTNVRLKNCVLDVNKITRLIIRSRGGKSDRYLYNCLGELMIRWEPNAAHECWSSPSENSFLHRISSWGCFVTVHCRHFALLDIMTVECVSLQLVSWLVSIDYVAACTTWIHWSLDLYAPIQVQNKILGTY